MKTRGRFEGALRPGEALTAGVDIDTEAVPGNVDAGEESARFPRGWTAAPSRGLATRSRSKSMISSPPTLGGGLPPPLRVG